MRISEITLTQTPNRLSLTRDDTHFGRTVILGRAREPEKGLPGLAEENPNGC